MMRSAVVHLQRSDEIAGRLLHSQAGAEPAAALEQGRQELQDGG